jgi:hypothetical protein
MELHCNFHKKQSNKSNAYTRFVSPMPDIKLSKTGYLVYANAQGIDFLRKLAHDKKTSSIRFLLSEYPDILETTHSLDINLAIENHQYKIHIAAFQHTGYVEMYVERSG